MDGPIVAISRGLHHEVEGFGSDPVINAAFLFILYASSPQVEGFNSHLVMESLHSYPDPRPRFGWS